MAGKKSSGGDGKQSQPPPKGGTKARPPAGSAHVEAGRTFGKDGKAVNLRGGASPKKKGQ